MSSKVLKKTRVIVSLIFFFSVAVTFLDLSGNFGYKISAYPFYLQFIPSAIKFFNTFTLASAGFFFVVILTLFGGRIYCSSICPMGTLQDIFSYLNRKINKRNYYKILNEYKLLRYSLLVLSIITFLFGNLILIDLLDPFSNTGRFFHNLFRPAAIIINNFTSFALNKGNIYLLYPVEIKGISIAAIIISLLIFVTIVFLSFSRGRIICNSVCPVGTLLGLISKISFYKIRINENICKGCNLCEQVCKAGCIDKKNKVVDETRCVSCFNCLPVCPNGGITYKGRVNFKFKQSTVINKVQDSKRRELLTQSLLFVLLTVETSLAQLKIVPKKKSKVPVNKKSPVSPPGSLSIDHFSRNCTSCHSCVSSCPSQVIQPALFEYGLSGIMQPIMNFNSSYCNQDCIICGAVCPSGAILPFTKEGKKYIQTGRVQFIKENCIVETEGTECGACSEHCPTKAVNMVPYKNLHLPEIQNEYCMGCGACEYACPVKPYKSIYVDGNPIHLTAKIKVEKKLEQKIDYKEEFPF